MIHCFDSVHFTDTGIPVELIKIPYDHNSFIITNLDHLADNINTVPQPKPINTDTTAESEPDLSWIDEILENCSFGTSRSETYSRYLQFLTHILHSHPNPEEYFSQVVKNPLE